MVKASCRPCALAALLLTGCTLIPEGHQYDLRTPPPEVLDSGWVYRYGDSPRGLDGGLLWTRAPLDAPGWQPTGQLMTPPGRAGHDSLWLRTRLPSWSGAEPRLYLQSVDLIFEVYLEDRLIYSFGELKDPHHVEFEGWPWHLVPLEREDLGKTISFRVFSSYEYIGIVDDVVLGSAAELLHRRVRDGLTSALFAFLFLMFSLLSFFSAFQWHERRASIALSVFALLAAVNTLCEGDLKQLVLHAPWLWSQLDILAMCAMPIALLLFVEETYGAAHRIPLLILRHVFLVYLVGATVLVYTGLIDLPQVLLPQQLLQVAALLLVLVVLFRVGVLRNREATYFGLGLVALATLVLYDWVQMWLGVANHGAGIWGLFLFMLSLAAILRHRFLETHRRSVYDRLTGIANRHHFETLLEQEWRRALRDGRPLGVILIDIDHFKRFNDTYGHQRGDECLKKVARCLADIPRRAGEIVARIGGEEFAALLPNASEQDSAAVAEKMRLRVEGLKLPHRTSDTSTYVTISAGVAHTTPTAMGQEKVLVARADKALYQAKDMGRNMVQVSKINLE